GKFNAMVSQSVNTTLGSVPRSTSMAWTCNNPNALVTETNQVFPGQIAPMMIGSSDCRESIVGPPVDSDSRYSYLNNFINHIRAIEMNGAHNQTVNPARSQHVHAPELRFHFVWRSGQQDLIASSSGSLFYRLTSLGNHNIR